MGHVREKYTKTYFTGKNPDGTSAGFGLEGNYQESETIVREFDKQILEKINFEKKHVLEIGFGRGESIGYFMENKIASYVGVDFAEPAFEICQVYLAKKKYLSPKIYCYDALEFLKDHGNQIENKIDVVVMLDVIEHIPRHEMSLILLLLKNYLSEKAVIVLNTPVYRFDNDVFTQGLDEKNLIDAIDQADFIPQTKGMHCNKYSIASLQEYMKQYRYYAITQGHIFAHDESKNLFDTFERGLILPYAKLWEKYFKDGYPLKELYHPDDHEFAYKPKQNIELITIEQTALKGIKFFGKSSALDGFKDDGALFYYEKHIKPNHIVFDVGCYVGLSALYFSKLIGPGGKVICFEPNKYNLLRTRSNFSINPEYIENIDLYDFGLSDVEKSAVMLLSDDIDSGYSSTSQLVKGGRTAIPQFELEKMGFFKELVKLKTLDNFVEETRIIPNIIKVDIEGAEVSFLKGAKNTLIKHKPILFIELHNVFSSCVVIQILTQLNYEFYVLSEEYGNRVQIMAVSQSHQAIGLSNKENVDLLFHSFCSYKAKLYQENLETYSKIQSRLYTKSASLEALETRKKEFENELYNLKLKFYEILSIATRCLTNMFRKKWFFLNKRNIK